MRVSNAAKCFSLAAKIFILTILYFYLTPFANRAELPRHQQDGERCKLQTNFQPARNSSLAQTVRAGTPRGDRREPAPV